MSINLSSVFGWFANLFKKAKHEWAIAAVAVVEGVKNALNSGVIAGIADVIDHVIGSHIAEDIAALLKKNINNILATALAIEGLPDNPTPEDLNAFAENVLKAFGSLNDKSKFYTTVSADIAGVLTKDLPDLSNITFGQLVIAIEDAYQIYMDDVVNEKASGTTA